MINNTLLFAGSNNPQSINQKLVIAISELLTKTKNTIIDLKAYDMPMYSIAIQNTEGAPKQALQLKQLINETDLIVISVPEYNGSMPAFFKNILDWLSRSGSDYKVFNNKSIILLSASPGGGGASSVAHTETVLTRLGAIVKGKVVVNNFFKRTGMIENRLRITDEAILKEIEQIITTINN